MKRLAIVMMLGSACAAHPRVVSGAADHGGDGGDSASASTCEPRMCGGSADPLTTGIGLAVLAGLVVASWLRR